MRRTTTKAGRREKRGTVLIFAVGALAVISIVGVSYVSVVRIERNSSAAVTRQSNLGESIEIVANEIKAVLAADLFGNKIVTSSTPKSIGVRSDQIRVWPTMFEDGEYSDYPFVSGLDVSLSLPALVASGYSFDQRYFGDPTTPPAVPVVADPWTLSEDMRINALDATGAGIGKRYETAAADDAWLATTEPEYANPLFNNSSIEIPWRNITNLRSAYRWVTREGNQNIQMWVRDDGRFADLAEFFNITTNLANPRLPLSADYGDASRNINVIDPEYGSVHHDGTGFLAVGGAFTNVESRTSIYDRQMRFLAEQVEGTPTVRAGGSLVPRDLVTPASGDGDYDLIDERFWVDTDGDLRPDARWQQIDSIGNLGNLNWVVATRIIDASSLVNINTALSFDGLGARTPMELVGAGRTPADIDLYRMLLRAVDGASYYGLQDVDTTRFNLAFLQSHLDLGLGLTESAGDPTSVLREITEVPMPGMPPLVESLPYIGTGNATDLGNTSQVIPNADLRSAHYEFVGISPQNNNLDSDVSYAVRDLYDLMAFWGTNHSSVITKIEQHLDGPEANPLYPQAIEDYSNEGQNGPFGPMLSLQDPQVWRDFDTTVPRPLLTHLRASTRNAMTTISGVGRFSPVPVLNDDPAFDGIYFREKVNLRDLAEIANTRDNLGRSALRGKDLLPIFEAFVWSLAPFGTDQPYSSDLALLGANGLTAEDSRMNILGLHYGGEITTGPSLARDNLRFTTSPPPNSIDELEGPFFAIRTAAALAVNLVDAVDGGIDDLSDEPTIMRVLRRGDVDGKIDHQTQRAYEDSDATLAIELGLNFAHGEVPPSVNGTFDPDVSAALGAALGYTTDTGMQYVDNANNPLYAPGSAGINRLLNRSGTTAEGDTGLTVVGLERQPFLVQSTAFAFYEDILLGATGTIDTATHGHGSVMFFELYNPWPENLTIEQGDYWIVIPRIVDEIAEFDPNAPDLATDIRFTLPTITNWGSGQSLFFYWAWPVDPTLPDDLDMATDRLDLIFNKLFGEADSVFQGQGIIPIRLRPAAEHFNGLVSTSTPEASSNVFFQGFAQEHPVLLTRRMRAEQSTRVIDPMAPSFDPTTIPGEVVWNNGIAGDTVGKSQFYEVVIDKLRPASGGTFPEAPGSHNLLDATVGSGGSEDVYGTISGYFNADRASGGAGYGGSVSDMRVTTSPTIFSRMMKITQISREKGEQGVAVVGGMSGWPVGILERPDGNPVQIFDIADQATDVRANYSAMWLPQEIGDPPLSDLPGELPHVYLLNGDSTASDAGSYDPDQYDLAITAPRFDSSMVGSASAFFRPYQMFVPDAPLNSVGEIGQISIYAHLCIDHDMKDVTKWHTVSEQMYRANTRPDGISENPYLGVLDPTRYIYGSTLEDIFAGNPVPENLTVPLATRVYDCFEALKPIRRSDGGSYLKQGVINVNTASARVLELLPFVKPSATYLGFAGTVLPSGAGGLSKRANAIVEYRDRLQSFEPISEARPTFTPADLTLVGDGTTNVTGLGNKLRASMNPGASGISAIGELSLLDNWTIDGEPQSTNGFAFMGATPANEGAPPPSTPSSPSLILPMENFLDLTPAAPGLDPINDAEERNRVFSAIANMVTTRSDVFIAWTVIRGYDPDAIERIAQPNLEAALLELEPVYNQRYLLVFDRSNVRTPTDRPELLLRFRLPDLN